MFTILEIELSRILEDLISSYGDYYDVDIKKDEEYLRLNVTIDGEDIGTLQINGRGIKKEYYYLDLLDIGYNFLHNKLQTKG